MFNKQVKAFKSNQTDVNSASEWSILQIYRMSETFRQKHATSTFLYKKKYM